MATAAAPDDNGADQRRVGIWGASQSGKSTFLSSLFLAVARAPDHLRVRGNNDESTEFLIRNTHVLNQQHRFPPATQAQTPLNWTLQMWVPNQAKGFLRQGPDRVPFDFNIDMRDVAGVAFAAIPGLGSERLDVLAPSRLDVGAAATENIAAYLSTCQGLLLLIDPIREREVGDAYEYFFGTLLRIAQTMPVPLDQRLPHYVAVCVTKFDEPVIYEFARDYGYLSYRRDDLANLPRVHENEAERFMRHLFETVPRSDIELLTGGLKQYFYPERIRFFVSSAVGFYVGRSGQFQEDDYQNVTENAQGEFVIRGSVRPVNVAEPLVWLGERMAATAAAGARRRA
jgi:hypothetical protein